MGFYACGEGPSHIRQEQMVRRMHLAVVFQLAGRAPVLQPDRRTASRIVKKRDGFVLIFGSSEKIGAEISFCIDSPDPEKFQSNLCPLNDRRSSPKAE